MLERGLPSYLDGFRDKIDMWLQTEQDDIDSDYKETLSGLDYESYCAGLLDKSGWNTRMTPQTGDQGVDIVASKSNTTIVIQCKKSASPIGNKAIQEVVAGMGYMNADGACVVTNSTFTKSAIELATANNVRLLHHDELSLLSPHVFRKN